MSHDEDTRIETESVTAGTLYQANTERAQSFEKMVVPLKDEPNVVDGPAAADFAGLEHRFA